MIQFSKTLIQDFKDLKEKGNLECDVKHIYNTHAMRVLVKCIYGNNFDEDFQANIESIARNTLDTFPLIVLGAKIFWA